MKKVLAIGIVALLLCAPVPADAGIKSGLKKVGHAVKTSAIYVVAGVAIIAFCSQGACN